MKFLSLGEGAGKSCPIPASFAKEPELDWAGRDPGKLAMCRHRREYVMECLGALEDFLHQEDDSLPLLNTLPDWRTHSSKVSIPFLDGNGRSGRDCRIAFMLSRKAKYIAGASPLPQPVL